MCRGGKGEPKYTASDNTFYHTVFPLQRRSMKTDTAENFKRPALHLHRGGGGGVVAADLRCTLLSADGLATHTNREKRLPMLAAALGVNLQLWPLLLFLHVKRRRQHDM